MAVHVPEIRVGNLENLSRVTSAIANDLERFPDQPQLLSNLTRPLESMDRRLQGILGADPTVDAAIGAVRLELAGIHEQAAAHTLDAASVAGSLRRASAGLDRAEQGARTIGDPVRFMLVAGDADKALPTAAWDALDTLEPYASIVSRDKTPLQGPLMKAFDLGRRLGAGEHVVIGASNIPSEPGVLFTPNHTGMFDMTLLGALRVTGDVRPMKVSGYTPIRRMLVDPILASAGAFTVEAGSKPLPGLEGITKGDMGIAVSSRLLRDGKNVVIFPQGNIEPFDTVSSLYDGATRASLESGRLIVPVANWGKNPTAAWSGAGKGVVTVIGKPIDVSSAGGVVSRHNISVVNDRLHSEMLNLLDEARSVHRERFGSRG